MKPELKFRNLYLAIFIPLWTVYVNIVGTSPVIN